jgi:hypothetical protein
VTALEIPSSNCTGKLQTRPLVGGGVPQEENRKCVKIITIEVKEKFVAGPRWWPDTRTDRQTDFDFGQHPSSFYLKHDVSETGFCLRFQV